MSRTVLAILSGASLLACLIAPFLYLRGQVSVEGYKQFLLVASVGWFVFATLWASYSGRRGV